MKNFKWVIIVSVIVLLLVVVVIFLRHSSQQEEREYGGLFVIATFDYAGNDGCSKSCQTPES